MSKAWSRWKRPSRDIALIAAFLAAVSLLPPDTSLQERQKIGTLRYCVANLQNPLITAPDGEAGPEHRLMQAVAADLNLRLVLVPVANMGRSFNPADWNVTRGQCDILGGGIADTPINRGFLTLLPTGQATRLVANQPFSEIPKGAEVGIYLASTGFDRVRLSSWVRSRGWRAVPLRDQSALAARLAEGKPLIASSSAPAWGNMSQFDLPQAESQSSAYALGLWRGDMTLTRNISRVLAQQISVNSAD